MTDGAPGTDSVLEAQLVRRARAGDAAAYGDLVTMHQAAAFRVAYVLLGSAADAEDAAQEAFVKAYLAIGRFRADEPFRPWLLRVVGNEARNRRRARGRRDGVLARVITAVAGPRGSGGGSPIPNPSDGPLEPSPEVAILAGEAHMELRLALARLRDEERQVVACRYLLDLSEAETAATLGIPVGTVKSRLHRGLRRLREVLAGTDDPGAPLEVSR